MPKRGGCKKMDGLSQRNDVYNERQRIIEQWMLSNVKTHGFERYDDLHIDKIDGHWKSRDVWVDAGLEAFQIAVELRDRHKLELTLALGFSLQTEGVLPRLTLDRKSEFAAYLDWSPPSLYLFQRGQEPWVESGESTRVFDKLEVQVLEQNSTEPDSRAKYCCYMEFRQGGELRRSVFVAGSRPKWTCS